MNADFHGTEDPLRFDQAQAETDRSIANVASMPGEPGDLDGDEVRVHTVCDSQDPSRCTRPLHDHHFLACGDCGLPMHYDYGDERYHHNDPAAPACHMIDAEPV